MRRWERRPPQKEGTRHHMETEPVQLSTVAAAVLEILAGAEGQWQPTTAVWRQVRARPGASTDALIRTLLELESRGYVQCRRPPRSSARWWRLRRPGPE